jgi:glyoxylase I family protein
MNPCGVHHVSINVDDVELARAFYTERLGLAERTDRPNFDFPGAWLQAGNQQVHLIGAPPPDDRGQHFALQVDDIDDAIRELRESGLTVSDPVPVATSRQAFLHDPSGNKIELHQIARAATGPAIPKSQHHPTPAST